MSKSKGNQLFKTLDVVLSFLAKYEHPHIAFSILAYNLYEQGVDLTINQPVSFENTKSVALDNHSIQLMNILQKLEEDGYIQKSNMEGVLELVYWMKQEGYMFEAKGGYSKSDKKSRLESWPKRNWWVVMIITSIVTVAISQGVDELLYTHRSTSLSKEISDSLQSLRASLTPKRATANQTAIHRSDSSSP